MGDEIDLTPEMLKGYIGGSIEIRRIDKPDIYRQGQIESIDLVGDNLTVRYKTIIRHGCEEAEIGIRKKRDDDEYTINLENDGVARILGEGLCFHSLYEKEIAILFPNSGASPDISSLEKAV